MSAAVPPDTALERHGPMHLHQIVIKPEARLAVKRTLEQAKIGGLTLHV